MSKRVKRHVRRQKTTTSRRFAVGGVPNVQEGMTRAITADDRSMNSTGSPNHNRLSKDQEIGIRSVPVTQRKILDGNFNSGRRSTS